VVLRAVIGKDGSVQSVKVISGHPMLEQAAVDPVKRWSYHPYLQNGEPMEMETQITANFRLER
jgi:periplasmic protein TonB